MCVCVCVCVCVPDHEVLVESATELLHPTWSFIGIRGGAIMYGGQWMDSLQDATQEDKGGERKGHTLYLYLPTSCLPPVPSAHVEKPQLSNTTY